MTNYRTSMQIISDLLGATNDSGQEEIKTTRLLTKANISHSRLSKFMNLSSSGLVNKIQQDNKSTFVITEKGRTYIETHAKFSDMAQSYGLDL
jgi:predicted transcriptional regulator